MDEQKKRLYDMMVDAVNDSLQKYSLITISERLEMITDYLLANGVIVPPCKEGDTVYAVTLNTETFTYGIHRGYISCIDIRSSGNYIIICHEGLDDEPYFNKICGRFDDFGKNIFFSREEAEAAIAERTGEKI